MKIESSDNASLVIKANENKNEMDLVFLVAEQMEVESKRTVVLASSCIYEQWAMLTTTWDYYQAKELRELYFSAKKSILGR